MKRFSFGALLCSFVFVLASFSQNALAAPGSFLIDETFPENREKDIMINNDEFVIEFENETTHKFNLKEIKFASR